MQMGEKKHGILVRGLVTSYSFDFGELDKGWI